MNQQLKLVVRSVAALLMMAFLVPYYFTSLFVRDRAFAGFSQSLSLIPGKVGSYLRIAFYRFTMTKCHHDCLIGFGTLFSQVDTEIGTRVYIGSQCNIGSCVIGADCLIGSGVHIMSGSSQHAFDDLDTPIQQQQGTYQKILIGEDTWIGNGALVMADIGKQCVVGAGSVVTKKVADYSVVAGNPAKVIKVRA